MYLNVLILAQKVHALIVIYILTWFCGIYKSKEEFGRVSEEEVEFDQINLAFYKTRFTIFE